MATKETSSPDLSSPLMATSRTPSGPVVFITGCTDGGIGHALALEFASRGCEVVATSRSLESMKELEGEGRVSLRALDVRSTENIRETVESVIKEFGRIDVLVNNAGVHLVAPLVEAPMDCFDMVFDTNVYGPMRLIQAVVPHMIERREGKIVNVGSVTALAPGPWAGVYSASKSALHALSDTLRLELRSFGISVTTVAPGAITSNIGNSSLERYNKIADWKYYKGFESALRARTEISQGPRSTAADVFAKKMVVLELRSFGIRVVTVAPGAIKSKLANSSLAKYNKMAGWKYYTKFEEALRARAELTQGPKSTPTDVFAKKMVTVILKKNPPSFFSCGHQSVVMRLGYYLPLCIRDFLHRIVLKC